MRHTTSPSTPTLGRRRRRGGGVGTEKGEEEEDAPAKQEEATTTTVTFVVEFAGDVLSQCQRPASRVAEKAQNVEPDGVPLDARG